MSILKKGQVFVSMKIQLNMLFDRTLSHERREVIKCSNSRALGVPLGGRRTVHGAQCIACEVYFSTHAARCRRSARGRRVGRRAAGGAAANRTRPRARRPAPAPPAPPAAGPDASLRRNIPTYVLIPRLT